MCYILSHFLSECLLAHNNVQFLFQSWFSKCLEKNHNKATCVFKIRKRYWICSSSRGEYHKAHHLFYLLICIFIHQFYISFSFNVLFIYLFCYYYFIVQINSDSNSLFHNGWINFVETLYSHQATMKLCKFFISSRAFKPSSH